MLFGLFGGAKNVISNKGGKNEGAKNFINSLIGRNKNNDINNTSEPSQDILTSKEYQEQQAQLNKALTQTLQQGNTPKANAPKTDKQSKSGVPTYDTQAYVLTDEVSDTNATADTLARLNALAHDYEKQFGEKLQVTSLKRHGDGSSWHDSGEAFDVAGGGLETNKNGAREWLMQRGQELGLTGLDEYANPSAHATGGHIHFSNRPGENKPSVGESAPSTGGVDISNRPGGHVAQLISERTGIPADWIWAQMAHETGNFNSELAREDHNYGGIKETREGHQGVGELGYRHFDSDEEYADYAAKNLNAYTENGIKEAKTIEEFAKALKDGGYYEDSLENYTNGLKNALGGDSSVKSGNMSAANAVGQMDDSAALSLMDDFIGDVVTGGQLSQEAIAALTDTNGHFVNSA